VGIIEDTEFQDDVVIMQPGDLVVIFSDGVTDMENPTEENYGEERLLALVEANRNLPAQDLVELIRDQVGKHAAGAAPFDDVTVVAIKRTE
jgi:sigma-B regulation protein RsbU (phosphoserine phosphatase)